MRYAAFGKTKSFREVVWAVREIAGDAGDLETERIML